MAGIKITDLGILTAPESADLLYIVDVSDTSQSPQGTSKKIKVENLGISGTWTPTISDFNDAIGNANIDFARYSRTGNIVTCTIQGSVEVDFSVNTNGQFDIDLPITSSSYLTIGCISLESPQQCNGIIKSGGRFRLSSNDTTFVSSGGVPFYAIFQYEIS
jgi:hypothetical protein